MADQWIEGCEVQRIMFRQGLVINLDYYNELVISVPMHLKLPPVGGYPAEVIPIDPMDIRNEERPLFNISGTTCTHAAWDDDGTLHLEFSSGHEIDVAPNDNVTAWELYGKQHGYIACLPRGRVRVVRHDLPDEQSG